MARWFVYTDTQYYPWAAVVEADTPEEALAEAEMPQEEGAAVAPLESVRFYRGLTADALVDP